MFLSASLALVLAGGQAGPASTPPDTITVSAPAPLPAPPAGSQSAQKLRGITQQSDSISQLLGDTIKPRQRPKAIDLSDWYYHRLEIHRMGSYAILPLFALQIVAGHQIFPDPANAPTWAKTGHRVGATLLAGVFTSNTITGVWNLWDTRSVPDRRTLRYVHAVSMLSADAAFTYAGAVLATQAQNSLAKRREHRTVALSAMGVTAASALMMKLLNSRPSQ
jgi:hypothetical protein